MFLATAPAVQPADWGGLILVVLGVFSLLGAWYLSRSYRANGTVAAALDTIHILEAKVRLLEETAAENQRTIAVLQEQVLQAAPVRALIETVGGLASQLDRIEGKLT